MASVNAARLAMQQASGSVDQSIYKTMEKGVKNQTQVVYEEGGAGTWLNDVTSFAENEKGHRLLSANGNAPTGATVVSQSPLTVRYDSDAAIAADRQDTGFFEIGHVESSRETIKQLPSHVEVPKGGSFWDVMEATYRLENGIQGDLSSDAQTKIANAVDKFVEANPNRQRTNYFHVAAGEKFKLEDLRQLL